jgi:pyridoxine 4-dehydrogenase
VWGLELFHGPVIAVSVYLTFLLMMTFYFGTNNILTPPSLRIRTDDLSSLVTSLENLELQSLVNTACAADAGFFDTAERYGSNWKTALGMGWGETEKLTNKLLTRNKAANKNSQAFVATKFTPSPWRTTPESVVEACRQSCKRLGVDKIDLYQLHMPDIVKPFRVFGMGKSFDEVYWEGLADCYNQGLVSNVGVSNYGPTLLVRCQEALAKKGVPLASNQIAYSLLGRQNGAQETVDKCNELGITVLAAFPFAMGILTGKYTSNSSDSMSEDTITSLTSSRKTNLEIKDLKKYALGDGKDIPVGGVSPLLAVMEKVAKRRGKTIAQVALNYIICKGAVPIPGARTQSQLNDNLGAMGWRLSKAEVSLLEKEADKLGFGFEGAGFKRTSEKFVGYGTETWRLD